MGHQLVTKNLFICVLYGLLSILQTLNSRMMYKDLHFDYYSFVLHFLNIDIRNSEDRYYFDFRIRWGSSTRVQASFESPPIFRLHVCQHHLVFLLFDHHAISSISVLQKIHHPLHHGHLLPPQASCED